MLIGSICDSDVEVIDERQNASNSEEAWASSSKSYEQEEGNEPEMENEEENEPELEDGASVTFDKHNEAVFCCDLTKDGRWAVTGGQDDTAFVWSTNNGSVKFECSGHDDSVVCVAFNVNDKLVATGDMKGTLRVWSVASGRCVFEQELADLTWIRWHPVAADVLLAGSNEGHCCLYRVDAVNKIKWMTGAAAATCGDFLPDGKRAVVLYGDSTIRVWDLASGQPTVQVQDNRNPVELCSLAIREDGLLACGSVEGKVRLVNSNTGKISWQFHVDNVDKQTIAARASIGHEEEDDERVEHSVESLCFADSLSALITGSVNGLIEIWDINNQVKRLEIKSPGGLSKLTMVKNLPWHVFVCGLDGVTRVFDIRDGKLLQELIGHRLEVLDISLNQQNDLLLSTSEDGTAKVFRIAV